MSTKNATRVAGSRLDKRRTRQGRVTGYRSTAHWQRLRKVILSRDSYACQICGAMLRGGRADRSSTILRPAIVDHLAPYEWPGVPEDAATAPGNLWCVCDICNGQVIRSIEDRHRASGDWRAVRRDKLAYAVIGLDGYRRVPQGRPIDAEV